MAHVDPGELKYRITVETPQRTVGPNGHYVDAGPLTFQCWAAKRSATGRDRISDYAAQSVDTVQFIVRWETRKKITRDSVILHRGIRYDIDWMDESPWADVYARIVGVSNDNAEA